MSNAHAQKISKNYGFEVDRGSEERAREQNKIQRQLKEMPP